MEYRISINYEEAVEANNEEEAMLTFMHAIESTTQMDFTTWLLEHIKVEEVKR